MSVVRFKSNPFIEEMIVPVKERRVKLSKLGKDDNVLVNTGTGEIFGTHVTTFKTVDSEQFIKLFTQNIALTFDLKASGIKAFGVLIWAVQTNALSKDEVQIDALVLEEFLMAHKEKTPPLSLSIATFKRGIAELENAKIIAKTLRPGRYWLNPNFLFNGDRIAFTTVIQKRKKGESSDEEYRKKLEERGQQRLIDE